MKLICKGILYLIFLYIGVFIGFRASGLVNENDINSFNSRIANNGYVPDLEYIYYPFMFLLGNGFKVN